MGTLCVCVRFFLPIVILTAAVTVITQMAAVLLVFLQP